MLKVYRDVNYYGKVLVKYIFRDFIAEEKLLQ